MQWLIVRVPIGNTKDGCVHGSLSQRGDNAAILRIHLLSVERVALGTCVLKECKHNVLDRSSQARGVRSTACIVEAQTNTHLRPCNWLFTAWHLR